MKKTVRLIPTEAHKILMTHSDVSPFLLPGNYYEAPASYVLPGASHQFISPNSGPGVRSRRGRVTALEDQNFLCGQCGKGYKYSENLNRHQRLECGKAPKYTCYLCSKSFYRRYEFKNHNALKHNIQGDID